MTFFSQTNSVFSVTCTGFLFFFFVQYILSRIAAYLTFRISNITNASTWVNRSAAISIFSSWMFCYLHLKVYLKLWCVVFLFRDLDSTNFIFFWFYEFQHFSNLFSTSFIILFELEFMLMENSTYFLGLLTFISFIPLKTIEQMQVVGNVAKIVSYASFSQTIVSWIEINHEMSIIDSLIEWSSLMTKLMDFQICHFKFSNDVRIKATNENNVKFSKLASYLNINDIIPIFCMPQK